MPTRIATLGRERRIATLARRVFEIEGPAAREEQSRAEAALLRANPQLATAEGFRPGVAVVVPSVAGLRLTEAVTVARADGRGLTEETRLRLQAGNALISERFTQSERRLAALQAQLGSRTFQTEVRRALPEALELARQATARFEEERAANQEKRAVFETGISQALEAVEALQALAEQARNN